MKKSEWFLISKLLIIIQYKEMETNSEMSNVIIEEDDNSDAETKTIYERFWEK
jgi:hypothetical protein